MRGGAATPQAQEIGEAVPPAYAEYIAELWYAAQFRLVAVVVVEAGGFPVQLEQGGVMSKIEQHAPIRPITPQLRAVAEAVQARRDLVAFWKEPR